MTLHLVYKEHSGVPLEVEGVTPDATADQSLAEIAKREVYLGNERVPLGDFFDLSGDAADGQMLWEGDLSGVHWIGAKMGTGHIRVAGNAGRHLGSEMRGGEIIVDGNAGDWTGGEMRGGAIRVHGNAGHLVGAAYRGSPVGMKGGTILIDGSAGNEVGHTMRRGMIVVGGRIGDLVGFNMLAGTVLALAECGIRHGAGMRRGTLGLFGSQPPPPMLSSFRHACRFRPEVMALILAKLLRYGFSFDEALTGMDVDLFNGDMIEGGRGEILIRVGD
ncbi:MAG: formylmethanofuran dehydrogenase subunit C [Pirellulaceae bacterium]